MVRDGAGRSGRVRKDQQGTFPPSGGAFVEKGTAAVHSKGQTTDGFGSLAKLGKEKIKNQAWNNCHKKTHNKAPVSSARQKEKKDFLFS